MTFKTAEYQEEKSVTDTKTCIQNLDYQLSEIRQDLEGVSKALHDPDASIEEHLATQRQHTYLTALFREIVRLIHVYEENPEKLVDHAHDVQRQKLDLHQTYPKSYEGEYKKALHKALTIMVDLGAIPSDFILEVF